jgi:hypothetical protein
MQIHTDTKSNISIGAKRAAAGLIAVISVAYSITRDSTSCHRKIEPTNTVMRREGQLGQRRLRAPWIRLIRLSSVAVVKVRVISAPGHAGQKRCSLLVAEASPSQEIKPLQLSARLLRCPHHPRHPRPPPRHHLRMRICRWPALSGKAIASADLP